MPDIEKTPVKKNGSRESTDFKRFFKGAASERKVIVTPGKHENLKKGFWGEQRRSSL